MWSGQNGHTNFGRGSGAAVRIDRGNGIGASLSYHDLFPRLSSAPYIPGISRWNSEDRAVTITERRWSQCKDSRDLRRDHDIDAVVAACVVRLIGDGAQT